MHHPITDYSTALKLSKGLQSNLPTNITIALGGNCNMDFFEPGLMVTLAERGVSCTIIKLEYDNWIASALKGDIQADYWIIWNSSMGASRGGIDPITVDTEAIGNACNAILEMGSNIVYILPELMQWDINQFSTFSSGRKKLIDSLQKSLPEKVIALDTSYIQHKIGADQWHSPRYWAIAKAACHPDATTILAAEAAKLISQAIKPAIKAVITDLDNTLWGNVIGDDGLDGIKLDPYGEGRPFLEMQRFLKDLIASGIPICVVSKNAKENAEEPFLKHPDMILKNQDIVYFHASWEPKHIYVERIIKDLNIGMSAACFLDDSPFEREEVKRFLPDVMVPELPEDPDQRVPYLLETGAFTFPVLHEDDTKRVTHYTNEVKRQEIKEKSVDIGDYLKSLDMVLTAHPITATILPRAIALVQKTNQFNLSNKRYQANDILKFKEKKDNYVYCFSLHDKFGDSGIISVLMAEKKENGFHIDTFVLSCRVFGRSVEEAIFEHLLQQLDNRFLSATFVPSQKNILTKKFLEKVGFSSENDCDFSVAHAEIPKHYIKIEEGSSK